MPAFFVLEIYCVPPDADAQGVEQLLQASEADVRMSSLDTPFPEIPVGIALVKDVSDYKIGDMIWAEGEFRGDSRVRAIPWEVLDKLAKSILRGLDGFVINNVNTPSRVWEGGPNVACKFLGVTIGVENGPVTATRSKAIRD